MSNRANSTSHKYAPIIEINNAETTRKELKYKNIFCFRYKSTNEIRVFLLFFDG